MMRIGQHGTPGETGSLIEKGWFQAVLIAVVVILGIAVWWLSTHAAQVARWVNPEKPPTVEKPTVAKPTVQPN